MLYLRVVPTNECGAVERVERLRACLAELLGAGAVKAVQVHPRGGYSVTVERSGESVEALLTFLEERGWRAVV